ncbi:hypothetical protein KTO58_16940 [Chitinophaga pendula]|uniref:MauE/DoxX family redox-associated membrane protein n=1 Tax=Chitinophaga TaxID=79328 RepID=UPI000BAEAA9D|nr:MULTISPECIES: MauE/DoxX family redox-associated membrane protein [Chitinophaga]ASZ11614.1 hypothetical protein CK934_11905 [Chitinophaga sp. MD30]UCJ05376.1 hypothetical protein KTO58_16940 [Chitinophaga pendula]
MSRKIWIEIIADLLIIVFAIMAAGQLSKYEVFLLLLHFQPYINQLPVQLSWVIPAAELVIAIILIIPRSRNVALYMVLITMSVGAIYRISLFSAGLHLPCICGNLLRPHLTEQLHIFFNLLLAGLALTGIILFRKEKRYINAHIQRALTI